MCEDLFEFVLLRWPLTAGASATGVLGAWLIVQDLGLPGLPSSPHFEGYLLIIGTVLITYAVVTIAAMNVTGKNRRGH